MGTVCVDSTELRRYGTQGVRLPARVKAQSNEDWGAQPRKGHRAQSRTEPVLAALAALRLPAGRLDGGHSSWWLVDVAAGSTDWLGPGRGSGLLMSAWRCRGWSHEGVGRTVVQRSWPGAETHLWSVAVSSLA